MKSKIRLIVKLCAFSILLPIGAHAELVKKANDSVPPDRLNGALKSMDRPIDTKKVEKPSRMTRTNQFRCWQDGDLIVDEVEWHLGQSKQNAGLLNKKGKSLHMFDYGETFCMYLKG